MSDEELEAKAARLLAFTQAHPELTEALRMWVADRPICRLMYPEAAELFEREMNDF